MKKIILAIVILLGIIGAINYLNNLDMDSQTVEKVDKNSITEVRSNFEIIEEKALKGDAKAQNDLGNIYANGIEVDQSYKEALKLFESSAKQGYVEAQFNLGTMYQNAIGVEQDYVKAIKYYKLAASKGHAEAKNNLESICEENPELCK